MALSKKTLYRYKLNEHCKYDRMSLEGIHLEREQFKSFSVKQEKLTKYIRTKENMSGIVDFECQEIEQGVPKIVDKPNLTPLNEREKTDHTYDELVMLDRGALEKIAKHYDIETIGMRNKTLIKEILRIQNELKGEETHGDDTGASS